MKEKKPKILFIGTDWGGNKYRTENNAPGAVSQYRLINPKKYLTEWYDIDYAGSDFGDGSEGVDTAIWYRQKFMSYDLIVSKLTDNEQAAGAILFTCQSLNIPLIVDIDDNIWEIGEDNPSYELYKVGSLKLRVASTYLSLANAIWCSTQPLADYVKTLMKKVYNEDKEVVVLPNCIDPNDFNFQKAPLDPNKIVIGWQGSTTHHEDLKIAMPAIARLMKQYPNVYLELLGGVIADRVTDLFKDFNQSMLKRIGMRAAGEAYDTFPKILSEQAWDVAIAPLVKNSFNESKSHIKWMEYAMYEIPCVASKVYPYEEPIQSTQVIQPENTGILTDVNGWFFSLEFLIKEKQLRVLIGENAKRKVIKNWDIKVHVHKWKEAIDIVLAKEK